MSKFKAASTLIVLFCICGFQNLSFAQDISTVTTLYTKVEGESVRKERRSFSMSNLNITVTDLEYNRRANYMAVKFHSRGFENGDYYEIYVEDIVAYTESLKKGNDNLRGYKFVYDREGGNPLVIIEMSEKTPTKIYFTELSMKGR